MLQYMCLNSMRVLNSESLLGYGPSGGVGLIGYCLCLRVRLVLDNA
jgi:hypothetical protein